MEHPVECLLNFVLPPEAIPLTPAEFGSLCDLLGYVGRRAAVIQ